MKITVGEIIDAIEKNGYRQIKGEFIHYRNDGDAGEVMGACAWGQAYLNLKEREDFPVEAIPEPSDLARKVRHEMWRVDEVTISNSLPAYVYRLNDNLSKNTSEIAELLRSRYADYLDTELDI